MDKAPEDLWINGTDVYLAQFREGTIFKGSADEAGASTLSWFRLDPQLTRRPVVRNESALDRPNIA